MTWTTLQDDAFHKLKEEISTHRVLALYDVEPWSGSCLVSATTATKLVTFASWTLSETEALCPDRKEALALTWAVERLSEYVLGKYIILETDHKPLVPI